MTWEYMQPPVLGYETPQTRPFDWWPIMRLFLLGPVTGGLVGFAQTSAAVLWWVHYGEPDFYFRGWSGVDMDYMLSTIGGGIVGVGYAVLIWGFERLTARHIRLLLVIPATVAIGFLAAALIATTEFQRRAIGPVFAPEGIAIAAGLLICVATSRRPVS